MPQAPPLARPERVNHSFERRAWRAGRWFGALGLVVACGSTEPASPGTGAGGSSGSGGSTGNAGEAGAGGEGAPDFPCAVRAAIEAKCQRCHNDPPRNTAPFPLMTWENTRARYGTQLVYEAMLPAIETDFMPFMELDLDPPVQPLTPSEKTTLVTWLEAGALPVTGETCP